jgi:uncharacterized protein
VIYLDTSWLVKLYVDELDSAAVRKIVVASSDVVVSDLAYVEFHSAVARRRRERQLTARTASSLVARFRRDWPRRIRVAVSRDVLLRAANLSGKHPLRTLDALQLASALLLADGAPEVPRFGAADARLVAAAAANGLPTLSASA